ncbi:MULTISPECIES: protein kinase family protein [Streptomyces]|uniref:Serine/threonine protein kinase n=1 Tax=Streptomyces lycii TaxID=2654337 RepID=A0ABQ7FD02_9ACTN|nr:MULTISPECIES: protein kinase family protein [Streptomyces]KAF4405696.1 serine/threonine protein kinase [Streptomyces lycii]PGH49384.1 serine/threonine protein kinase [Streptomyces sp. Ru87]
MAERSTAAVGVADTGGDKPLTARTGEATSDGVEEQDKTGTEPNGAGEAEPGGTDVAGLEPPELHSGHKLAGRYRLEECLTRLDGFSSWRAVDEKLRRAVGVHVLPAGHPRSRPVLAAARSAALLGDPRFVQVLDAVEEDDLVYVVHEWLPDATELTAVLASGPMEPYDAYQLVSQVSQAMAAAHREGLSHLRLTPGSVLRTDSGQYRIRGLAVMAALRGVATEHPQRTDTEAIGALLYAALTQRWPYEEDAYGLSGLPKGVGLIAPDQVRAGVHRGLAELAMRALANNGSTPLRAEQPCTTPEELSKAVAALPRIRPPEPSFATPTYQPPTYPSANSYAQSPARGTVHPPAAPVVTPPPPLQTRTGKALKWTVSALLIAALGLGSWQVASILMDRDQQTSGDTEQPGGDGGGAGKQQEKGSPLKISDATEYAPLGPPVAAEDVPNAIDGDRATAWITPHYKGYANFGNLPNRKEGSGLIVDLGRVQEVTGLNVSMYRSGQTAEVLAAPESASAPASADEFSERLSRPKQIGSSLEINTDEPVRTRYVLIHITELAPDSSSGQFRGGISEITVTG